MIYLQKKPTITCVDACKNNKNVYRWGCLFYFSFQLMLFIHAGTDYVGVGYPGGYERIPRNGVEYAFPARLVEITKNYDISKIYLIQ